MQVEDAQDGSTAEALSDQRAAMLRAEALHARESSQPTDLLGAARAWRGR